MKHRIKTMGELHADYLAYTAACDEINYNWGRISPTYGKRLRPLVPGEAVMIMGETGSGKTALLQQIARQARALPQHPFALETLFCELELPDTLCYERFAAMQTGITCRQVEADYKQSNSRDDHARLQPYFEGLEHLKVCDESRINEKELEQLITVDHPERYGVRPVLVCVDYIGLMNSGNSGRYERAAAAAQEIKRTAKATNTIIVFVCQVHRTGEDKATTIGLHSARGAGELEESAGVIVGLVNEVVDHGPDILHSMILKSTKDGSGHAVDFNFDGATMRITERRTIT